MGPALHEPHPPVAERTWGRLPARMRVLFVAGQRRTGRWLADAFASDSASDVHVEEAKGSQVALARLRDEVFDAVLVSHEPGPLDALDLVEGLRAGGSDEPLVILGTESEQELLPLAFEAGADAYVCVHTTTTRALIWLVARAIERAQLLRENARLTHGERHRLEQEQQETQRLLEEQRAMIRDLEALRSTRAPRDGHATALHGPSLAARVASLETACLPEPLVAHYRELLRAYVIMGSGNLSCDMGTLVELLVTAGVSSAQAMQLHVRVLEELVRGLGTRSARHVMNRADLLVLEVLVHLAEGYRRRYHEHRHPPQQLSLPGFEPLAGTLFEE